MSRFLLSWMVALSATPALTVSAQSAPPASAPASQAGQGSATGYRSALEGYQAFSDEKVLPWKPANDTVGQIGGWRAYAKEAQDAAAKGDQAANPSSPASNPAKR